MFAEDSQGNPSPPDKQSSSSTDAVTYSTPKSTSKIHSSQNSRASKKPCKYIRAKQTCPFGVRCHFSHDTPQLDSPLTFDQEVDTHNPPPDRRWRNKPRPPSGPRPSSNPRRRPSPDGANSDAQPKKYHPPRNRQKYSKSTHQHSKQPDVRPLRPEPDSAGLEQMHVHVPYTDIREEDRSDLKQPKPLPSEKKQPSADTKKTKQGPSELNLGSFLTPSFNRPPVQRPKPKKASKSSTSELRQVELEQLEMRFPDAVLVEKGRERTVYSISYQPADPEWDFGFKSLTFEVTFPGDYPLTPLSAQIPQNEAISDEVLEQVNSRLSQHLTSGAIETGTLMFRPFLHWLDRNITSILRESLPKIYLDDVSSGTGSEASDTESEMSEESGSEEGEGEGSGGGSAISAPPKAGTEIRLVGLSLSPSVATITFSTPKLVVACGRCKKQEEIRIKPESGVGGSCSRCQNVFTVVYHPALVHAASSTVGYLDLNGCSASDLVLLDCAMRLVCLECNRDNESKTMMFGQPKDFWCRKCHSKLSIGAQQCRFLKHQPQAVKVSDEVTATQVKVTRVKEAIFKLGQPLPDYGVCSHYKKSHRWFRFPCCGKAFPCDVCHDSSESHVMERAKRMICGYCSMEQVYSADKPCSGCGSDMTSTKHTSYWEGGKGCRNKSIMNRRDKHKYSSSSLKTSSQKGKRVGKKEKN